MPRTGATEMRKSLEKAAAELDVSIKESTGQINKVALLIQKPANSTISFLLKNNISLRGAVEIRLTFERARIQLTYKRAAVEMRKVKAFEKGSSVEMEAVTAELERVLAEAERLYLMIRKIRKNIDSILEQLEEEEEKFLNS